RLSAMISQSFTGTATLLIVQHGLRRRIAHFKLCAHFLDLSLLFFEHGSHGCVLLLLLCHSFLQRFHFAVFLKKLVEHHRVHGVVAHGVDLPVFVTHYEIWIHFSYFLGDQAELWPLCRVGLVVKSHRFKRQNRLAGFVHRLNSRFETTRGTHRAEL